MFASILACISVTSSINFKVGAVLHGSGSAEDPILISSVDDWNEVADKTVEYRPWLVWLSTHPGVNPFFSNFTTNTHFKLTNDITFDADHHAKVWVGFQGVLDGQNKTITLDRGGVACQNCADAGVVEPKYACLISALYKDGKITGLNFKLSNCDHPILNAFMVHSNFGGIIENCQEIPENCFVRETKDLPSETHN